MNDIDQRQNRFLNFFLLTQQNSGVMWDPAGTSCVSRSLFELKINKATPVRLQKDPRKILDMFF